jgi:hypothetical protein
MKRIQIACLLLFTTFILSNCDINNINCVQETGDKIEESFDVNGFNAIQVANNAKVYIVQSDTFSLKIEAYESILQNLLVYLRNNSLIIENDKCANQDSPIIVRVSMPYLKELYLSGSGGFSIDPFDNFTDLFITISGSGYIYNTSDTLKLQKLQTTVSGSGDMDIYLIADEFDISISGSGSITPRGMANKLSYILSGSGSFRGFDFQTKYTDIFISGSGNTEVHTTDELYVNISGSGNVYYKGYPKITSQISGSGSIIDRN